MHGVHRVVEKRAKTHEFIIVLGRIWKENDEMIMGFIKTWFGIRVSMFGRVSLRGRPVAEGLTLDFLMIPSYGRPLTRFSCCLTSFGHSG